VHGAEQEIASIQLLEAMSKPVRKNACEDLVMMVTVTGQPQSVVCGSTKPPVFEMVQRFAQGRTTERVRNQMTMPTVLKAAAHLAGVYRPV
jgi:hypothetical protein